MNAVRLQTVSCPIKEFYDVIDADLCDFSNISSEWRSLKAKIECDSR